MCCITSSTDHSAGSTGNLDGPSVVVVEDAASISGSLVRAILVTNVTSSGVELSGEPCRFILFPSFLTISLVTKKNYASTIYIYYFLVCVFLILLFSVLHSEQTFNAGLNKFLQHDKSSSKIFI